MSAVEPLSLLEWVRENTHLGSLEQLSLASGIDLPTLRKIDAGEALPARPHTLALRGALPGLPSEVLARHRIPLPDYESTPAGCIPEGRSLQSGTAIDLRVGDLVPYVPPPRLVSRNGAHWVGVRSIEEETPLTLRIDFGGVTMTCDRYLSIRFARSSSGG